MKSNRITSAGTDADSSTTAQVTTSSHNGGKPNVVRSASLGVAQNIFDTIFVSTAMWATEIQGMRYPTYETFIWAWDNVKKERGKMIKQYYHSSRGQALKFHFRYCRLLAYKQLKQKLPSDSGWVDFD